MVLSSPIPLQRTKKVAYSLVFVLFPWPALLLCPSMSRCPFVPIIQLGALVCFDLLSSTSFSSLNFSLLLFSSLLSFLWRFPPLVLHLSIFSAEVWLQNFLFPPLLPHLSMLSEACESLTFKFPSINGYLRVCDNIDKLSYSDPRCSCLRVENRPSVLGIFIYVPWGGVGWGNNVHVLAHSHDVTPRHVHLHVRTYVMLRWRCVTSCRGGVRWGLVG